MKTVRLSAYKVTEFIREPIEGKREIVSVEWFFDNKGEALDKMYEINSRKPFLAPFLTYVYGVYGGEI